MLRAVQQTIESKQLLKKGDHILLAVSGGADSVSLTYVLHYLRKRLRLSLTIAHLNHRIRGKDADADERFVRELAWRLGIPFVGASIDVPAKAKDKGISLEMAAREARYDFMARVASDVAAHSIATAHTADDQVETVVLKLARGAGPQGLAGIPYESQYAGLRVIRPMLDVTHERAVRFLESHGLKWREDPSNRDMAFLRNRVRHEILPLLEKRLNRRIREAILRTREVVREENDWMNGYASRLVRRCALDKKCRTLDVKALKAQPLALRRRILRLWLSRAGVEGEHIDFDMIARAEQLITLARGTRSVPLTGRLEAVRRYNELSLRKRSMKKIAPFCSEVVVPGETVIPDAGLRIVAKYDAGVLRQSGTRAGDLPAKASIDIKAVNGAPIYVRTWSKGDRIKPYGFSGTRKLQDVFTDQKIPRDRRSGVPVFECRGEVLWVPGYRVARGWEVRDASGPSLHLYACRL